MANDFARFGVRKPLQQPATAAEEHLGEGVLSHEDGRWSNFVQKGPRVNGEIEETV